jgi:chromosome segregation ATPase
MFETSPGCLDRRGGALPHSVVMSRFRAVVAARTALPSEEHEAKMTQEERVEAALARLNAALASLEAARRRIQNADHGQNVAAPDLAGELEQTKAEVARLEAASDEASRLLKGATEALAAILSRQV